MISNMTDQQIDYVDVVPVALFGEALVEKDLNYPRGSMII